MKVKYYRTRALWATSRVSFIRIDWSFICKKKFSKNGPSGPGVDQYIFAILLLSPIDKQY